MKNMHNDFAGRSQREEFRFHYKGCELLPYAEQAYLRYLKAEVEARERAAALLGNMAVRQNAPELEQCREDIEKYGKIREQCAVWVHQFRREPDREFPLQLGDVTFFGLVSDPTAEDIARARNSSE
ncbi:MAG: hypothetical protein ACRC8S_17100 [Fimbriiglobus sp.]